MTTELNRLLKRLIRRVGKMQADSLAEAAAERLREVEESGPEVLRAWRPWHLLDILHLSLLYGRTGQPAALATEESLASLMNILYETDGHHPAPQFGSPGGALRFMQQAGFEQLWFQDRVTWVDFGRFEAQFGSLPPTNALAKLFYATAGLPLAEYGAMLWVLWAWAKSPDRFSFKSPNLFANLTFDDETVQAFLKQMSINLDDAPEWLLARKRLTNPLLLLHEPVPFVRKPVIAFGGTHFLVSRRLLEHHVRTGVVETCRERDSNLTGSKAGGIQESYLAALLAPWASALTREGTLKKWTSEKVADFVVHGGVVNLIVESKAIDAPVRFRVDPSPSVADDYLGDIFDAFKQCVATATLLRERGDSRPAIAWVVTRTDFWFTSGRPLWDGLLAGRVDAGPVQPDAFFITSVAEFETIIGAHPDVEDLIAFMQVAGARQRDPSTMSIRLAGHLPADHVVELPHVREAYDRLVRRVEAHFVQPISGPSTPSSPRSGTPPPPAPAPASTDTSPPPATSPTHPAAPLDPPTPLAEPPEQPTASSPSRPSE